MSKKFVTVISALLLVALLAGCGSSTTTATTTTATEAPAAEEATEAPVVLGDPIKIGIPDDATNGGRGIKLLESVGLIEVDPDAGWTPELKDVTKYLYNIEIVPAQANTLPSTLDDFGAATINGTYAIPTGLIPSQDGLAIESQAAATGDDGNPFVNVIVARTADKDNETYKTVCDAFQSDIVGQYLVAKYSEAFVPAFDYQNTEYTDEELVALIDDYTSDSTGKTVVKVGVCGASNFHWNAVQYVLDQEDAGIYIELVEFDAYNLPNEALNSGDIDLNSFQHKAYLANEVSSQGYEIETIADTLMAPLTLYSQQYDSVDALKEAAGALE
jgi:ABC-type metal ion transport system substrate-binding protein